jgi:CRP-like cAMP-binding protein
MSFTTQASTSNRLLASLLPQDRAYLASISRLAHPLQGQALTSRSDSGNDVWFPHTGIVALIAIDADGRSVQTGLVGRDGCVGLEALFDRVATLPDAIVQIDGPMSVIPATQLRSAVRDRPSIQVPISRFLYGLAVQSLRTIACNRLHGLLARCCRWLLTMRDEVKRDDLPLTQEALATLLGSGRPRINGLLAKLEANGWVQRRRGWIHVLAKDELEAHSCDCYRKVRHIYASLNFSAAQIPLSRW